MSFSETKLSSRLPVVSLASGQPDGLLGLKDPHQLTSKSYLLLRKLFSMETENVFPMKKHFSCSEISEFFPHMKLK